MEKQQTVCYVASSSGGHIIPCLTLAQEEVHKEPSTRIIFFTSHRRLDQTIIAQAPHVKKHIKLALAHANIKGPISFCSVLWALGSTLCTLFFYFIKERPTKVVCTGGLISIPATLCARLLAIPVELFELNVKPGKATAFLASRATTLRTCFEQTAQYLPGTSCIKTPYPIRFFHDKEQLTRQQACLQLSLIPTRKTITVLGGSQGSQEINQCIKTLITTYPELHKDIQIIHQIGNNPVKPWQDLYRQYGIPAHVFDFHSDLASHYAAADLIICRSGAGTLFEALFFSKPCITLPLITPKNDHQVQNALAMQHEYPELFTALTNDSTGHNNLDHMMQLVRTKLEHPL